MPRHFRDLDGVEFASVRHLAGQIGSDYLDNLIRLADGVDCDRDELIHEIVKDLCKTIGKISFDTYRTTESAD